MSPLTSAETNRDQPSNQLLCPEMDIEGGATLTLNTETNLHIIGQPPGAWAVSSYLDPAV